MTDPRIKKLAKVLTSHSIKIKPGDSIRVSGGTESKPLLLEIYKEILKKGAVPMVNLDLEGSGYIYFKYASNKILKRFPKIAMYIARNIDGVISVGSEYNTKEFSNVDPKKIAVRSKITDPISKVILKKDNWVGLEFPTNSLAQDAEMSLKEFEDFVYDACIVDWKKVKIKQEKLKKILDKGKKVRIIGKNTDISFSIENKKAVNCFGTRNMPDGEVYTEPVKNSVNGYIGYDFPAIKGGREVEGIKLEFKNGKVVKASATKNEKYLKEMINIDKGASYVGEFGIGTNFKIKKFVKQILFDEKIGGTIHLALGMAYPETGGENKSALHWDMIKDLRKGGKIIIDGKVIQENGKFKFKF